ncbi:hypothetical protein PR048_000280 [Dryococelus australis]|uniref:Uncharacterized protein n=1 Tax=Dryococelus australis TaxID=614101 RepID=A0ABQ9IE59_9NEOP|nr:hypothetical protein PR048_000280 [Dryococelus australis]
MSNTCTLESPFQMDQSLLLHALDGSEPIADLQGNVSRIPYYQGRGEIPEKTRLPTASSDTIPTCENPVTWPGIGPGSPRWGASSITTQLPRTHLNYDYRNYPLVGGFSRVSHPPPPAFAFLCRSVLISLHLMNPAEGNGKPSPVLSCQLPCSRRGPLYRMRPLFQPIFGMSPQSSAYWSLRCVFIGCCPTPGSYGIRNVFPCKSAIGSEACRAGLINCDTIAKDKIDVKHVYTEVDFAIVSQFIRHALDDSEPIADKQGNS